MWNIFDAVKSRDADRIKKIVSRNPLEIMEHVENEDTPLHVAVASGNVWIVELLLRLAANPWKKNNDGNTILHLAALCRQGPLLDFLLNRKCVNQEPLIDASLIMDKNNKGETALCLAAAQGLTWQVKALEKSCRHWGILTNEMHAPDHNGMTPLSHACKNGFTEIIEFYLENDFYTLDQLEGSITFLEASLKGSHIAVLNLLSRMRYESGDTTLRKLIQEKELAEAVSVIEKLRTKNVRAYLDLLTSADKNGRYVIDSVAEKRNTELLQTLLYPLILYLATTPGETCKFGRNRNVTPLTSISEINHEEAEKIFSDIECRLGNKEFSTNLDIVKNFQKTIVKSSNSTDFIVEQSKYDELLASAKNVTDCLEKKSKTAPAPHLETFLKSVQTTAIVKRLSYEVNNDDQLFSFSLPINDNQDTQGILITTNFLAKVPLLKDNDVFKQTHEIIKDVVELISSPNFDIKYLCRFFSNIAKISGNKELVKAFEWVESHMKMLIGQDKDIPKLLLRLSKEIVHFLPADQKENGKFIVAVIEVIEDLVFGQYQGKTLQKTLVIGVNKLLSFNTVKEISGALAPFIDLQRDLSKLIKEARANYYAGREGEARIIFAEATLQLAKMATGIYDVSLKNELCKQVILPEDLEYEGYQILRPMLEYLSIVESSNQNIKIFSRIGLALFETLDRVMFIGFSIEFLFKLAENLEELAKICNLSLLASVANGIRFTELVWGISSSPTAFKLGVGKHQELLCKLNRFGKVLENKIYMDLVIISIVVVDACHDIVSMQEQRIFFNIVNKCVESIISLAEALELDGLLAGGIITKEFSLAIHEIVYNDTKEQGVKRFKEPLLGALNRTITRLNQETSFKNLTLCRTLERLRLGMMAIKFTEDLISIATSEKAQKAAGQILSVLGLGKQGTNGDNLFTQCANALGEKNPASASELKELANHFSEGGASLSNYCPPIAIANLAVSLVNVGATVYFGIKIRQDLEKIESKLTGIATNVEDIKRTQHHILSNLGVMQQQMEKMDTRLEHLQSQLEQGITHLDQTFTHHFESLTSQINYNTEILLSSHRYLTHEMQKGFAHIQNSLSDTRLEIFKGRIENETLEIRRALDFIELDSTLNDENFLLFFLKLTTFLCGENAGACGSILNGEIICDYTLEFNSVIIHRPEIISFLGFLEKRSRENGIDKVNNLPNFFYWIYVCGTLVKLLENTREILKLVDANFNSLNKVINVGLKVLLYFEALKKVSFFEKLFKLLEEATTLEAYKDAYRTLELYSDLVGIPTCREQGLISSNKSIWEEYTPPEEGRTLPESTSDSLIYQKTIKNCVLQLLQEHNSSSSKTRIISRYELILKRQLYRLCERVIILLPEKKDELKHTFSQVNFDSVFFNSIERLIDRPTNVMSYQFEIQEIVAMGHSFFQEQKEDTRRQYDKPDGEGNKMKMNG